jgi:23S rRNA pseudouridine1911/1915/1917 synthase
VKSSTPPSGHEPPPTRLTVAAAHAGLRADVFLTRELPLLSRRRIRQKIQMGETLLNGHRCASSTRLRPGDEIILTWRGVPQPDSPPDLPILHEDEILLAVNKPAGIASHPMGRIQSGTVVQFARRFYADRIRASLDAGDTGFYPRLVNRLDRFTSGVVLLAKTRDALHVMQAMVMDRLIGKGYVALVEGVVKEDHGRIDLPIGPDPHSRIRVKMAPVKDGLPATSEFVVMRRLPAHTLLAVSPITGRQHQIRVHLAAIGHPIVGDLLYKDETLFIRSQGGEDGGELPRRHCLHAETLRFDHPLTHAPLTITAPLPADFLQVMADLEADGDRYSR